MTAQGYSPEQAQLWSETPTPEMSQDMAHSEQEAELARREHPVGQMDQEEMRRQEEMQMMPPPEDPNEGPRHEREKEKLTLQEQMAQSAHGREKEKLTLAERQEAEKHKREKERLRLQDVMENRKSKRDNEGLRRKDASEAQKAKLTAKQAARPRPTDKKGK